MLKYYWGGMMVGRVLGIFILRKYKPALILTICSVGGFVLLGSSFALSSSAPVIAMWLFLGTGLFHSIMWPVIYNLALEDLGTTCESSFWRYCNICYRGIHINPDHGQNSGCYRLCNNRCKPYVHLLHLSGIFCCKRFKNKIT